MILYFSATGNTEYIARLLGDKLNDDILNIADYMKGNLEINVTSEKPYVILSPIYLSTIPHVVLDKLKTSRLSGNKNVYYIMTCAGSGKSGAANTLIKLSKILGLNYKGLEHLSMPQDYLVFFKIGTKEENDEKFNNALESAEVLLNKIKNNEDFNKKKSSLIHKLTVKPVEFIFNKFCIKPKKFYTTNCIGCTLCAKACPLNNIKMENKKPTWGKNCIHCTACINHCPKHAIEYGKKTVGKDRYLAKKYKN